MKRGWLWPIVRGIAKALVIVAVFLFVAALVALVASVRLITWPYRSTHNPRPRSRGAQLEALTALIMAGGALWATLRKGEEFMPKGWHGCENPNCRAPIPNSSRARYCSEPCRGYARTRRDESADDDEGIPF